MLKPQQQMKLVDAVVVSLIQVDYKTEEKIARHSIQTVDDVDELDSMQRNAEQRKKT